nr:PREDICTED: uncharacterized protein LOC103359449 [Stegastes partitus]
MWSCRAGPGRLPHPVSPSTGSQASKTGHLEISFNVSRGRKQHRPVYTAPMLPVPQHHHRMVLLTCKKRKWSGPCSDCILLWTLQLSHHPSIFPTPPSRSPTTERGQYYWEVDVCNSSIYRIGVISLDGSAGWWLERHDSSFCAVYDGSCEPLCTVPPQIKSLGVFLNIGGGTLSFHNPVTREHLTTLPTRFGPAGVRPALGLGQGRLRLRCGLPPPPHVFLSKDSAYRGPRGADASRWRREVPFQSVRRVIQRFEELALSDSDSGLVSSFGSSCSTLASLPDVAGPGTFPSGQAGQETGTE